MYVEWFIYYINWFWYVGRDNADEDDKKIHTHNKVTTSLTQIKNAINKKWPFGSFWMTTAWCDRHNLTRPRVLRLVLCYACREIDNTPTREDYTHHRAWSRSCSRINLLISVATPGSRYSCVRRCGSSRLSLLLRTGFEITFAACRVFEEKWFLLCGVN